VPACPAGALRMEPDYELAVTRPADLRVAVRLGSGNGRESDGR
jgi:formate hydrogenlyase subunit 6/NADH:ubiquinone oxidoreductase subunit I